MQVKEMMEQPYVIEKDISLKKAAKLINLKNIGGLMYVPKNRVRGLITKTDLVKFFGERKKISEIMSKNIISIEPDDTIESCIKLMNDNKINVLPVIDKEKRLVGIISFVNIMRNMDKLEGDFLFG
jgi:CBS domain-containing protein